MDSDEGRGEVVVVEFIDPTTARSGFDLLADLVDRGLIRILDLEFIHGIDGVAGTLTASRVDRHLARFDSAAAGVLGRSELDAVAADLEHHTTAALLLAEGGPIDDVAGAWQSGGARVSREKHQSN